MSELIDKFLAKIITIVVVITMAVSFKSMLADSEFYTAFGALMGSLPFAKLTTDTIVKLLKYNQALPAITVGSVLGDTLKLAVMACIQPIIMGILTRIFLRVPTGDWQVRKTYMKGLSYRIKELMLTVLVTPFIALTASFFSTALSTYITDNFGTLMSIIFGIVLIFALLGISLIPLIKTGTSLFRTILWRTLVTLLGGMATTYMTSALCLLLYIALLGGIPSQILSSVVGLIVWLIIMEQAMKFLKYAVIDIS